MSATMFGLGPDVRRTLGWVAIGYRLVAVVWVIILAVGALVGGVERPAVVVGAVAVLVVWNLVLLVLWRRTPPTRVHPAVLVVDVTLALATYFVPAAAGATAVTAAGTAEIAFRGGYPFSAVVLAVHLLGRWGGAASGLAILVAAVTVRLAGYARLGLAQVVSDVVGWFLPTAVLIWAYEVVVSTDAERRRSDEALAAARADQARAEERTAMAAHLHDSVLQTLALIQRDVADTEAVSALARTQERELRAWLQGASDDDDAGLRGALEDACAEVEDRYRVRVELVTVGDAPLTDATRALVSATREAIVNAAKHSGVDTVDVYAEAGPRSATVFVRDRGVGFDKETVGEDRLGIGESIVGRMVRQGGRADVRSEPGKGTEIQLEVPTS